MQALFIHTQERTLCERERESKRERERKPGTSWKVIFIKPGLFSKFGHNQTIVTKFGLVLIEFFSAMDQFVL